MIQINQRPWRVKIHYNRHAKDDRVWTVHTSKSCIPANLVRFIGVEVESVYKPEKKENPRGWMEAIGLITVYDDGLVIISKWEL